MYVDQHQNRITFDGHTILPGEREGCFAICRVHIDSPLLRATFALPSITTLVSTFEGVRVVSNRAVADGTMLQIGPCFPPKVDIYPDLLEETCGE